MWEEAWLIGKEVQSAQLFGVPEVIETREFQDNKEKEIQAAKDVKKAEKAQKNLQKEQPTKEKRKKAAQKKMVNKGIEMLVPIQVQKTRQITQLRKQAWTTVKR